MIEYSMGDTFLTQMLETMERYEMARRSEPVLVAVSGGLDSMALLFALRALHWCVAVAHFDHGTRSGQSALDAAFVRETCAAHDLPCYTGAEQIEALAAAGHMSFEACARERRYAFLLETARRHQYRVLATAHHENDQAETALMGLLGLTGGFGAAGILPCATREGVRIVRPFIETSRADIEHWAVSQGVKWREDATNSDKTILRNRLRHETIPQLKTLAPHACRALARATSERACDSACLDAMAARLLDDELRPLGADARVLTLSHSAVSNLPNAMRRHLFKVLAFRLNIRPSPQVFRRVQHLVTHGRTGEECDLSGGFMVHRAREEFHILPTDVLRETEVMPPAPLSLPGTCRIHGYVVRGSCFPAREMTLEQIARSASPEKQYFDWDAPPAALYLGFCGDGARMRPHGMNHRRKVRDVLIDAGVPSYLRHRVPALIGDNEILWLAGCRRAAALPVTESTATVLELEIIREPRLTRGG